MRDKERIPEFLDEIERVWKENPDMRFGQLVSNLTSYIDGYERSRENPSVEAELMDIRHDEAIELDQTLWNAEIDEWKEALEKFQN